ncbi:ovochymase-like [Chironomus tepperi]|uniref:ovochymase-like n=1 Tax=Chironomus tepperi TaxID=113505 RepID=UPI00391F96A5
MSSLSLKLLFLILFIDNITSNDLPFGSECQYNDGLSGTCTNVRGCPTIFNQIQRKLLDRNDIVFCNNQLRLICCPDMDDHRMEQSTERMTTKKRGTIPPTTASTTSVTPIEITRHVQRPRISELKCKEYAKATEKVNYVLGHFEEKSPRTIITSKCLHNSVPLVIGGVVANIYEFPHQALLGYNKGNPKEWLCGGSLLSPQFVLTAAHCKFSEEYGIVKFVKLGVHNRKFNNNKTVTFEIDEIIIHPNYDSFRQSNDIALIKLDKVVKFSEYVYPICLPTKQLEVEKGIVTGFGRTGDQQLSDYLMKATVEEFSNSDCEYVFENYNGSIMLCYGHHTKSQDSCEGDSGGPLQISNDDNVKCTYTQVGIVSFGSNDCGRQNVPAVYVNVFYYLDWIEEISLNEYLRFSCHSTLVMGGLNIKLLILILIIRGIKNEDLKLGSKCQNNDGSEGVCGLINNCKVIADKLKNRLVRPQEVVCNQVRRYVCCPTDTMEISSRSFSWDLIEHGPSSCGKPAISFGTAFHGVQVKRGAYPWTAALTKSSDASFFCGGSILSNKLIVTAAHCIEGKGRLYLFRPRDIFVVLGAHDLDARQEPSRITASVKSIYVHHDWNPHIASYDADIAVLELEDEITFNRYIQPICIAVPNSEAALLTDGIVVGFGKSEYKDVENIARVIPSPIHSYEFCANSSDHVSLLTHRTFCGGYANGTSVCVGDSGSGLIVKYNGAYYLRGIVSSSLHDPIIGCNIDKYSVFTDILAFYSWITTGKDESILLRELQEEVRRLRLHGTTTQKTVTTEAPKPAITTPNIIKQVSASSTNKANQQEFPHQALLGRKSNSFFDPTRINWLCDGSLISQNFVLTASRCLAGYQHPEYVKLGMNDRLQNDSQTKIYEIERVMFPNQYNPKMPEYHKYISLVKLNESVIFNEFICPIGLPSKQLDVEESIASGFLIGDHEPLLKLYLNKQSHDACSTLSYQYEENQDLFLCYELDPERNSKCGLEEGSPLQILNSDQSQCPYTLIGVLSVSKFCTDSKYEFINVYRYIDWIKKAIGGDDELYENSCNIRIKESPNFNIRKGQGNKANNHEFPHQALVGYDNNNPIARAPTHKINWLCGGSLISDKFILTDVDCLNFGYYGRPRFVKLGMINRYGDDNQGEVYGIKKIHQHPDYNRGNRINNIGLLELNDTVNLNEFICSACLPTATMFESQVVVTGFAHENYDGNKIEHLLKYDVNKKADSECKSLKGGTNSSCYSHASEQIKKCGVTEGSPLQVLNTDQSKCPYTQVGVIGFRSYDCNNLNYLSTDLYSAVDWIKEIVGGGDNAIVYEFPHQALLGYKTTKTEWLCGGSLISSNFVMTAAHCVKKKPMPKVSYVKLGMLQSSSTNEFVRIYGVAKEFCHPNYKPITYNSDIALLELNETVQFNYYIYPICLPTKQHDDPEAILTGFGRTGPDDALSENLQKVSLEYFSHDDCRKKHTNVDSETMICYGHHSEKKDSCKGDSGGPIQVRNDNQSMCTYTQIGIVSSGPRQCGTVNVATNYCDKFISFPSLEMNALKYIIFIAFLLISKSKSQSNDFLVGTRCITKANETGVCKYYKDCPHLIENVKKGKIKPQEILKCNKHGIFCCVPDVPATTINIVTDSSNLFEFRSDEVGKISEKKCKEYSKYTKSITYIAGTRANPKPIEVINDKCHHKSTQLIAGGTAAHQHEFPHQALLGYKPQNEIKWVCGGSLVSPAYVLTAAHCKGNKVHGRVKFVKFGMIDRSQNDRNIPIYNVQNITVHHQYNPVSFDNDIALLKLDREVNFNEFIYPICLPTRQHDVPKAVATGLGRTGKEHQLSERLLKVVLEKFTQKECKDIITTRNITKNMLCYGSHSERRDSCPGDSGGPLQVLNDAESYCTYKLIGVVSFGHSSCGTIGIPGDELISLKFDEFKVNLNYFQVFMSMCTIIYPGLRI